MLTATSTNNNFRRNNNKQQIVLNPPLLLDFVAPVSLEDIDEDTNEEKGNEEQQQQEDPTSPLTTKKPTATNSAKEYHYAYIFSVERGRTQSWSCIRCKAHFDCGIATPFHCKEENIDCCVGCMKSWADMLNITRRLSDKTGGNGAAMLAMLTVTCDYGHPLQQYVETTSTYRTRSGFACNDCGMSYPRTVIPHFCAQCDYDLCESCHTEKKKALLIKGMAGEITQTSSGVNNYVGGGGSSYNVVRDDEGHVLVLDTHRGNTMGWICNYCDNRYRPNDGVSPYYCAQCDFDLCPECYNYELNSY